MYNMSDEDLLSGGLYLHSAKMTLFYYNNTLPAQINKRKSYQVCWRVHDENWSIQGV